MEFLLKATVDEYSDRGILTSQTKAAVAGEAIDFCQGAIIDNFDRMVAMGAADMHRESQPTNTDRG